MTSHTTEQDIHRILSAALGADEAKNYATAIDRYLAAVEAILRLDDTQQRERLNPFALRAMDRAEELKGVRRLDQHQAAMPQSAFTFGQQLERDIIRGRVEYNL